MTCSITPIAISGFVMTVGRVGRAVDDRRRRDRRTPAHRLTAAWLHWRVSVRSRSSRGLREVPACRTPHSRSVFRQSPLVCRTGHVMSKQGQQQPEEVAVDGQGRVTIPAEMLHAAGLKPGETAYVYAEKGSVVVETRATYTDRIRWEVAANWTGDPSASVAAELAADRRAEAAREEDAG